MKLEELSTGWEKLCAYMSAVLTIECHFCGRTETHEMTLDDSRQGVAHVFYDSGWRRVTSKHFQVVAPACPDCCEEMKREGQYKI